MVEIKSKLSELSMEDATARVEEFLSNNEVPFPVITKINIAVDEIYSNIQRYSGAENVSIICSIEGDSIRLVFVDDGVEYDPLKRADPDITLSAEEREIGGLGIFMVKKFMDSTIYEFKDNKNVLTLTKKFI